MSATQLENASLQAPHHNPQRLLIVVRLLAQGSVVMLTLAFGGWAMADLGSSTLTAQPEPIYVAGCPVPDRLDKSSAQGGVGKGCGCSKEGVSYPISSRQPGVRL